MNVVYTDPDGREGTYHPKLGFLRSGEPFELEDEVAKKYVPGLLQKSEVRSQKSGKKLTSEQAGKLAS